MRFSVITVCLNPGRYLTETIASVLRQDYADFEYWLIDGGSTDGTLDVISSAAAVDPRVKWQTGCDAGIADAMNRGIHCSRGEIISFLHADDRYPDAAVLAEVDRGFHAVPQALWLTGGIREVDTAGRVLRELPVRTFSYCRLMRNNIIYHPATFVRREVFASLGGFDTSLSYAMDYDFWLRLGRASRPVEQERVLAEFRVHEGSLSSREKRAALDEEYRVRCRYVEGRLARLGHGMYQAWRRWRT